MYNSETNSFHNNTNVKIIAPGFGGTCSVERVGYYPYMRKMVKYFVLRGYKRGKSIAAAPYDWRLAAGIHAYMYTL